MAKFPVDQFTDFLGSLQINTKERGIIPLGPNMLGSQKHVIREVVSGIEDGIHEFVILKSRQLGITTGTLGLDLYWVGKYEGLNGALVVHEEAARDEMRSTLELYYSGLPDKWKRPTKDHNRNQWVFRHGTKLLYRVAGTTERSKGKLGRSAALALLHATEPAFWGDSRGFSSLKATLARENPNRLYIWESTANGYNEWWKMCQSAKTAATQKFIFVTWWHNDLYRIKRGTPLYRVYWGASGSLSTDERTITREVKNLYGHEIDDEQWAWYRWFSAEQMDNDEMMQQEYPHTEEEAFIGSGDVFFNTEKIAEVIKSLSCQVEPKYMRLICGDEMQHTRFVACNEEIANLSLYFGPAPNAYYVMGADPAYGSSAEANNFAISIWRCYADRCVQVAEFCDPAMNTKQFAWAMAYLIGAYQPCLWNLEINGPGQAVLNELDNIKRSQAFGDPVDQAIMRQVVGRASEFYYKRYDAIGGVPQAKHTKSTYDMKERYYGIFRDYFEGGLLDVASVPLLEEMRTITREGGSAPAAENDGPDDRCVAASLAVLAWNDQIRTQLMIRNETFSNAESHQAMLENRVPKVEVVADRLVRNYLDQIGFKEREKRRVPGVSVSTQKQEGRPL